MRSNDYSKSFISPSTQRERQIKQCRENMKENVKKWSNQDFRIEETTWFIFRIQPGFSKQLLQVAYIAETGEWALRKQKRWDFSRSINLFGRVFPPFRSDAPALVFILEPPPHPHCPSHTIQWNAKQECSNFWINHIWYNILAKVRSSPEVKSTREKRKKNCHTDQNIQIFNWADH